MDIERPRHPYGVIILGSLLLLAASLYCSVTCARDDVSNWVVAKAVQNHKPASAFLDEIIGERNEGTDESHPRLVVARDVQKQAPVSAFLRGIIGEPNEVIDESDRLEEGPWYAGTWDATLYLNAQYPRTVAIRMKLLDKDTRLPIKGVRVALKGEYERTWTERSTMDAPSQIDLSIFPDLRKLKSQPKQQSQPKRRSERRKFGLDATSDSNGIVVFSLNWQKEYTWQAKAEDKESAAEGGGATLNPDDIECVVRLQTRHPEYKDTEIPVDFKRMNVKLVVLDLGEGFPGFNNKSSRRSEFFETIRAEDYGTAHRDVKNLPQRRDPAKCGPYFVYDLGEVLLERTAPRTEVRRPVEVPSDTRELRPSRPTRPSEKTVEQKDQTGPAIAADTQERKAPPQPEPRGETIWTCPACGYIHRGEGIPNFCPHCGKAPAGDVAQKAVAPGRMPELSPAGLKEKIIDLGDGVMMRFLLLPEGVFDMGSPLNERGRDSDEGPVHDVRIDKPFYMGVYEVTQEQYEKVMRTNLSEYKGPKYPVHMVSWNDAQEFCQALSSRVGGRFRLPTEAEWEYACRAGTTTAYYWGAAFDGRYAWTMRNSGDALHEVGTRLPNAWGLHDMSGNLWEWCEDSYDERYPSPDEPTDLKDSSDGRYRVLRGGSWNVSPAFSRSANRSRNAPDTRKDYDGFRVVLDAK